MVSPVSSTITLAARNSKSAPAKPSPSRSPSMGCDPPLAMRSNSAGPSSNSWLPTALMSRPRRFMASMVGSSWNRAETSGEAPIRSPAETKIDSPGAAASAAARFVARKSARPVPPKLPDEVAMFPWKSLMARIWRSTSRDRSPPRPRLPASTGPPVTAIKRPRRATKTDQRSQERSVTRTVRLLLFTGRFETTLR